MRKTKLPTSDISKAYLCPVCYKRKMYVSKFGEERGKVRKCQHCGYVNRPT